MAWAPPVGDKEVKSWKPPVGDTLVEPKTNVSKAADMVTSATKFALGDVPAGLLEAGANLVTGAVAMPYSWGAGLGTAIKNTIQPDKPYTDPAAVARYARESVITEPRTTTGKAIMSALGALATPFTFAGDVAGELTKRATGSTFVGDVARDVTTLSAGELGGVGIAKATEAGIPQAVASYAGKGVKRVAKEIAENPIATVAGLINPYAGGAIWGASQIKQYVKNVGKTIVAESGEKADIATTKAATANAVKNEAVAAEETSAAKKDKAVEDAAAQRAKAAQTELNANEAEIHRMKSDAEVRGRAEQLLIGTRPPKERDIVQTPVEQTPEVLPIEEPKVSPRQQALLDAIRNSEVTDIEAKTAVPAWAEQEKTSVNTSSTFEGSGMKRQDLSKEWMSRGRALQQGLRDTASKSILSIEDRNAMSSAFTDKTTYSAKKLREMKKDLGEYLATEEGKTDASTRYLHSQVLKELENRKKK